MPASRRWDREREHLVFLLWGSYAQAKGRLIDGKRHRILKAPHPSPLSAHRGFLGCGHFSSTNQYLEETGQTPINWQLARTIDPVCISGPPPVSDCSPVQAGLMPARHAFSSYYTGQFSYFDRHPARRELQARFSTPTTRVLNSAPMMRRRA
jgi:hypothetical protein